MALERETLTLTDAEAADLLGCSVRHFRRLAERGDAPRGMKLGALRRWRRAEIEAWIEQGCPSLKSKEHRNV